MWTRAHHYNTNEDKNGVVLEEFTPKTTEAMSEQTADIMVRLLQGVVDGVEAENGIKKGTGVRLRFRYQF